MLNRILPLVEPMLGAETPEAASDAFFDTMQRAGASYLQTRRYRRPAGALTSESHYAAGGVVKRIAPKAWQPGNDAFQYVCFECNPLLDAVRQGVTRYRFGDFAPHDSPQFGKYWDALDEAGIDEALCATSYGTGGRITSLHLGFRQERFEPDEALAFQMAGLMLTERLMDLTPVSEPDMAPAGEREEEETLTPRERDCMAFVSEGKSDWEISVILGISQSTAKFHVDNARRKLGAVNRAQAVARFVVGGFAAPGRFIKG